MDRDIAHLAEAAQVAGHQRGRQDGRQRPARARAIAGRQEMIAGPQRRLAHGACHARIGFRIEEILRRDIQRRQQIQRQVQLVPLAVPQKVQPVPQLVPLLVRSVPP